MLTLAMSDIVQILGQILWPAFRVGAFFMTVPIIGTRLVPVRIRLVLTIMFTWMLLPMLPEASMGLFESALTRQVVWEVIWISIQQILIGLMLGFSVQLLFHIAVLGGQMIAMQNGLGFATLVDPVNGINVAAVGQLYLMLTNLLFLSMNGHLAVMQVLVDSFTILPVIGLSLGVEGLMTLVEQGSWLFGASLLLALPAVTALLLVNFSFGLMARLAPTLNIFSIGFPFGMVFGLFMIWLCLSGFLPQFERFTADQLEFMQIIMGELR